MSDNDVWCAYIKGVTPLGKRAIAPPSPHSQRAVEPTLGHTLDLHGLTLTDAHAKTVELLSHGCYRFRYVTIITGLSGAIRQEFLQWIDGYPMVQRIETINGGGGFRVHFRKRDR
jgi:hypothetical protein